MYDFLIYRRILFAGFFFAILENECIIFEIIILTILYYMIYSIDNKIIL